MDPLTLALIMGGTQAVSGGLQYMNAEDAREYERQKQAELEQALARIGIPSADPAYFTPEVFQYLENFNPEVAQYVRESDPRTLALRSSEGQRAQQAEQQVLQDIIQEIFLGLSNKLLLMVVVDFPQHLHHLHTHKKEIQLLLVLDLQLLLVLVILVYLQ